MKKVSKKLDTHDAGSGVQCTLGTDVRTIVVRKKDITGCEVSYTKFGKEKTVAEAGFDWKYCEGVQQKIRKNLESSNFKCADK